jgi:glycosyltransferase involved in cell wall biosynthesis
MKILMVAEKYPPVVGGGETHVHQLAEGLADRGVEVTVLTEAVERGPEHARYRSGKVALHEVSGLVAACQRLDCKAAVEALHLQLDRTDADVVHVFNYVPAMLVSWLRPAVRAKLAVSLFETLVPGVRVFDLWRKWDLERALQRGLVANLRPDLHVCGSQAYLRWTREAGFTEPATVIGFGTDLGAFVPDIEVRARWRAEHGFTDEVLFLVPARPVPRKQIEDAITALSAVRRRHPLAHLLLTAPTGRSDPRYVAALRDLIAGLGLDDHVHWVHDVGWKEMPALYSAADAVVLPSSHDGWGIALNEGMAARRPVITTDIEGHDEVVVHERNGLLYPPGDTDALAAAMTRVLTDDLSALVEQAHREARDLLSADAVVDRHLRAYQALLAGSPLDSDNTRG